MLKPVWGGSSRHVGSLFFTMAFNTQYSDAHDLRPWRGSARQLSRQAEMDVYRFAAGRCGGDGWF